MPLFTEINWNMDVVIIVLFVGSLVVAGIISLGYCFLLVANALFGDVIERRAKAKWSDRRDSNS